jgi:hypothetical protein
VRDQGTGRNDSKREFRVAYNDRVARVITAAEPRDDVVILRVEVYDPAFALVAPLNADDDVDAV